MKFSGGRVLSSLLQVEYEAAVMTLRSASTLEATKLIIEGDSQIVKDL